MNALVILKSVNKTQGAINMMDMIVNIVFLGAILHTAYILKKNEKTRDIEFIIESKGIKTSK